MTDTERAIRRATCGRCRRGEELVDGWHGLRAPNGHWYPQSECQSMHAELLPLFQSATERAKAEVLRESARTLQRGIPQMSIVEFLDTMALYHDGEAEKIK